MSLMNGGSLNSEELNGSKSLKYYFGDKQMNIISLVFPVNLKGWKVHFITEVVEGDFPWLFGKRTLKKMEAILDIGRGVMKVSD